MVFLGLVTPWRLARRPTSRSPVFDMATTEGVVRAPSAFSIISGSPPLTMAIAELVVPRSIPSIFDIYAVRKSLMWESLYTRCRGCCQAFLSERLVYLVRSDKLNKGK